MIATQMVAASEDRKQLQAAIQRLLAVAETRKWWAPRELRLAARCFTVEHSVLSLAFWQMVSDGRLELDAGLRVRRSAGASQT